MTRLEREYLARGMDYAGALDRAAGDETLLIELLRMFPEDKSYFEMVSALKAGDVGGFAAAHSLKGSSAMLGLTGLFDVLKTVTELLRADDAAAASAYLPCLESKHSAVTEIIKSL